MLRPKVVVLDEPVSALDLSIQAQVLNLLVELQDEFRLAYLFVSHNLSVVHHFADDVMVMYLGRAVEQGTRDAIFDDPQHPYTRALLAASPVADPARRGTRVKLVGELPSPLRPPPGCVFHPRCPLRTPAAGRRCPSCSRCTVGWWRAMRWRRAGRSDNPGFPGRHASGAQGSSVRRRIPYGRLGAPNGRGVPPHASGTRNSASQWPAINHRQSDPLGDNLPRKDGTP